MIIHKKYLSPDENGGGTEVSKNPNFSAVSSAMIANEFDNEVKEHVKTPEEIASEKADADKNAELERLNKDLDLEESQEEKDAKAKADADAKAKEDKEAEDKLAKEKENEGKSKEEIEAIEKEKAAAEIKVKALELEDDKNIDVDSDNVTWSLLAEKEGNKIEEDSYEEFIKAHDTKVAKEWEKKVEQTREMKIEDLIQEIKDPKARLAIEMTLTGMSIDDVMKPLSDIEAAEQLSNIDLIRLDRKLRGWDEAKTDKEVEYLTESGFIDHESDKLRTSLKDQKTEINQIYAGRLEQHKQKMETQAARLKEQQASEINKALTTVDSFMEVELPTKTKAKIAERVKAGYYDKLLSDPNFKVRAILNHEFEKTATGILKNEAFEKGRETKTKDLLNVPPAKKGNSSVSTVKTVEKQGSNPNFKAIREDMAK